VATLREIRRRIRSIQSTQQITSAMKMVAAAKLRRAQRRLLALRPYAEALDRLRLEAARRFIGNEHPLLEVRPERRVALLVLTSDKGLCGSFNHHLVRAALQAVRASGGAARVPSVLGRKGARAFAREGVAAADTWTDLPDPVRFLEVEKMAERFIGRFEHSKIDAMDVLFAEFRSPMSQPIRTLRLLPIQPLRIDEIRPGEEREAYLFEPDDETLAEALLMRNVAVQLFRALCESQTSEHGARMTAMENATDNADEMIDTLTLQYHRARQAHITTELLDVVGGANALTEGD
jgi:F-type H+-transporting ATPase subunit gamma